MAKSSESEMESIKSKTLSTSDVTNSDSKYMKNLYHSANLFQNNEIDLFNKTYRFGLLNPYGAISTTREYLFFTKPDLHIYQRNDDNITSFKNRYNLYIEKTKPLLDYYAKKGILYVINGNDTVKEVSKKIDAVFKEGM